MLAPNKVDRPGPDSYALARFAARAPRGRMLDLCTGTGVVALFAAGGAEQVVGVDLNPRCTNFARFNALFNAIDNCTFLTGDGYSVLGRQQFAVITANPPYVPSPRREILCAHGGSTGEEVTSAAVRGLAEHLAPGGVAQIQTIMVESGGRSFSEKLGEWMGSPAGFGRCCSKDRRSIRCGSPWERTRRATGVVSDPRRRRGGADFFEWAENYLTAGITAITAGYVCIERAGTGPFRVDRLPILSTVAEWPVESPNYPPFECGTAHPDLLRSVLRALDGAGPFTLTGPLPIKTVELEVEHPLFAPSGSGRGLKLDATLARAMARFEGRELTAAAVRDAVAAEGGNASRAEIEQTLKILAAAGVLGSRG